MDIFKRFRKKPKEPPGPLDNAIFCMEYYGRTIKDNAVPCPIHGTEPIRLIDITKHPHEGMIMCRTFGCEMGTITGDPYEVTKQWNEKCEKVGKAIMGFLKLKLYGSGTIYINPEHISTMMDSAELMPDKPDMKGMCIVQIGTDKEHSFVVEATAEEIVEASAKLSHLGTFLTGGF